ncbi:UBP-type zinc finger domain-containing protein [Actinomycetospora termitidis]|uniref:UBP-type zinc finger domain-containing protein n=1 Tax=Actinomycetospora termitidis TaxID=3053470 RepID=A0ABT7M195_9PSEU|nr:UBP-type zinc finger domain-containing protein [Actinomycetospora sp. Odt1-22]MDL5154426.1 UBP-type zinc finger domain-containing protein [Actinomycetospora sp. Odt1-22]
MTETSEIDPAAAPSGPGCLECENDGGWWFHLRRCAACGHVGCCDSSPAQHATAHARSAGHPILTSYEPGEYWFYDDRTGTASEGPDLAVPRHHPEDQTVPGPASRVPGDWVQRLH